MRAVRAGALALLVAAAAAVVVPLQQATAQQATAAGTACQSQPAASATPSPAPSDSQAQSLLNPQTSYPISRGSGQLVALLDTGVATDVLGSAVVPGVDLTGAGDGTTDCDGRGTLAASLITAPGNGTRLAIRAVAPGSRVLPVRVSTEATPQQPVSGDVLAAGITDALARGATVIDVSFAAKATASLQRAVAGALARGVVVVASVGDDPKFGTPYPAAYPGVIGVAPTDSGGSAVSDAVTGRFVTLSAPGAGISGLAVTGGYVTGQNGAALAAAQVAGAAALVRAWRPAWTPAQVVARLEATADRPAATVPDPALGYGLVDPYVALTAPVAGAVPTVPAGARQITVALPPKDNPAPRYVAIAVAAAVLVAAVGAAALMAGVRRGRRRGWRPAAGSESPLQPDFAHSIPPDRADPAGLSGQSR